MAPVPFSTVCFRAVPPDVPAEGLDQFNEELMHRVNRSGEIYISHTKLKNQLTLRLAIGNLKTESKHVARAWELLQRPQWIQKVIFFIVPDRAIKKPGKNCSFNICTNQNRFRACSVTLCRTLKIVKKYCMKSTFN